MFKSGQKLRHKATGKVVEFRHVTSRFRGKTKIQTSDLDLGPQFADAFEVVVEELEPWTLKTSPEDYLKRYPEGKNAKLAKLHVK